ncbi:MAG TPA: SpoIIE family protein phosphatase [Candidatus Saccharimonadales bacterium]|nr:SpoIIE family protein phosphatase [Candidatus Saccharimonadales bacterium]
MSIYSRSDTLHVNQLANAAYASVDGLSPHSNEDAIKVHIDNSGIRACMADGHWGDAAARKAVDFMLDAAVPSARREAIAIVGELEEQVYRELGRGTMRDTSADRTPEAAVTSIAVRGDVLHVASYGDCGLLVARNQQVHYAMPQSATWLGCYSYLGLRARMPIREALVYEEIPLQAGDSVLLYTDGLTEWAHNEELMITPQGLAYNMFGSAAEMTERLARLALTQGVAGTEDDCSVFAYTHGAATT